MGPDKQNRYPAADRTLPDLGWTHQRGFKLWVTALVLVVLLMAAIITAWMSNVRTEVEEQNAATLEEVTRQYGVAVRTELRAKGNLLLGVAERTPEDLEGILNNMVEFETLEDLYLFGHAGYITLEGVAHCGDRGVHDVAAAPFWADVSPENVVYHPVSEDVCFGTGEKINLVTAPVIREDGTTQGYVFAAYPASLFQELLSIDAFDGQGRSYVVLPDGDVLTCSDENISGNVLRAIDKSGDNAAAVEQMQADFAAGSSGHVIYETSAGQKQMHYMPIHVLGGQATLYLATTVPTAVLEARAQPLMEKTEMLVIPVVLGVLAFGVYGILSYRAYQKRLLRFASTDALTGGANYNAFRLVLRQSRRGGWMVSVDLEDFKRINTICGVQRGDQLIREMWQVLSGCLGPNDLGAHIAGDRFVAFLSAGDQAQVTRWAEDCHRRLCALSQILDLPRLEPKFGLCPMAPEDDTEDCYGKANLAKKTVTGRRDQFLGVYDKTLRESLERDKALEDGFDQALTDREFQVWYQPKYTPDGGAMTGAEALVRWQTGDGTMISPGVFIPLFERAGLVARLDEYVFRAVCAAQARWRAEGKTIRPVSVNLSQASLYVAGLADRYLAAAQDLDLDPALVPLEITESVMADAAVAGEQIARLRDAGFPILLDDFGQGFSSLSALRTGDFHTLKLDKSLIDGIGDPRGETLLGRVIDLAHGLGLRVTAEGVETGEQAAFLGTLSCDDIQGFYFSRPQPEEIFERLLT